MNIEVEDALRESQGAATKSLESINRHISKEGHRSVLPIHSSQLDLERSVIELNLSISKLRKAFALYVEDQDR